MWGSRASTYKKREDNLEKGKEKEEGRKNYALVGLKGPHIFKD